MAICATGRWRCQSALSGKRGAPMVLPMVRVPRREGGVYIRE